MDNINNLFNPFPPIANNPPESNQVEKTLLLEHITPPGFGLVELLDKKVILVMRDGRTMIGVMRSFDQFNNVVVQDCFERIVVEQMYHDEFQGTQVFRGENVIIVGEIDEAKEPPKNLICVGKKQIVNAQKTYEEHLKSLGLQIKLDFLEGE
eukprot:TRINITY_DN2113_c0_g1_i4.p2 TRINITY_DN2113_c0_g1~~TRINITY_DN2113_c0_g1_i4.p2  ORF type:complete len:152 (-),score=25.35 TRINITY_DN2113_c0_g1_i4:195-650(-)